ncbi:MAG: glycine cleavage T C-terminal barrel domain-containing protein, partial [Anaerolineales bacterium]|nr:glycine cleavage T C-terminal barrel domain-containing protein [Anaerolineales bacterium]
DWATPGYTNTKVQENYSRRFQIAFPNEELPAARPLQMSPIYGRLAQANAVWGVAYGLEYALWFQRDGEPPVEEVTFKRSNAFERVAAEVATVRESVGLMETTGFAKFEFTGSGARGWLSNLLANRIPDSGRLALAPMLNHNGKLIGDFTVATLEPERFMLVGSGVAERYYERYFDAHLPADGSVQLRTLGPELAGLSIAGPKTRETLQALTRADLSADAFPFLHIREMNVGMIPALVGRISYTGDLGYELWVPASYQAALFDLLREVGEEHGMGLLGLRALDSLRLEKSFGAWASEYRPIYDPYEAGLGRFVELDKDGFVGREAAERVRAEGPARRLMTFVVEAEDADVLGDEPIWHRGEVIGWVTSGGYAHWSRVSVALGYVPVERADADDGFEIEVLGVRRVAHPQREPLFDPTGARMRG